MESSFSGIHHICGTYHVYSFNLNVVVFRVDLSIKDCLLSIGPAILRGHFCGHLGPAGHWAIWVLLVIGLMLDSIE